MMRAEHAETQITKRIYLRLSTCMQCVETPGRQVKFKAENMVLATA